MKAIKEKVESQAVDTMRAKLAELKFQNQQKKSLSNSAYKQQALKVLLDIEKMTALNPEEVALKEMLSKGDMNMKQGEDDVGASIGQELTNYGQN